MMNVRKYAVALFLVCLPLVASAQDKRPAGSKTNLTVSLKSALSEKFLIGVAMNEGQVAGNDARSTRLIRRHFNSIVAEDCMKSERIQPQEGSYDFEAADKFVAFGEQNKMFIIGHALIWHSQLAKWFCIDNQGNPVSPEVLKKRMREHIHTLVKRYKGRVHGWDVVNEAIEEDGEWRNSPFYNILGEEYIALAFQYAHEADPEAELYYNDYNMYNPNRREKVVQMVRTLQQRGIRIDGIGMQAHWGITYPNIDEVEASIKAFAKTGVKVMITEYEMTVLPVVNTGANVSETEEYRASLDPYPNGLPQEIEKQWNQRTEDFFKLFIKYQDVITRVTVWGASDGDSWKNNWPVKGRTDYPLLFDRSYQPKPATKKIMEL